MNKILIACEESQRVTIEFRKLGLTAFSCDVLPCSGGYPEWHIKGDVLEILHDGWDMVLAFPPCKFLTVTGNRWFNIERYGQKAIERHKSRERAAKFFMEFTKLDCLWAIENSVGVMSTRYRESDQIIHPYYFGDPFEKRTCLWLNGLPPLTKTNEVNPPPRYVAKSGKTMARWYAYLPHKDRSKMRSKTFPGVARAMAMQWGAVLKNKKELIT
jgi:hypothetical protein